MIRKMTYHIYTLLFSENLLYLLNHSEYGILLKMCREREPNTSIEERSREKNSWNSRSRRTISWMMERYDSVAVKMCH